MLGRKKKKYVKNSNVVFETAKPSEPLKKVESQNLNTALVSKVLNFMLPPSLRNDKNISLILNEFSKNKVLKVEFNPKDIEYKSLSGDEKKEALALFTSESNKRLKPLTQKKKPKGSFFRKFLWMMLLWFFFSQIITFIQLSRMMDL